MSGFEVLVHHEFKQRHDKMGLRVTDNGLYENWWDKSVETTTKVELT